MKIARYLSIAIISSLFLWGCVPAIIGSAAYSDAKIKKARQEFASNFQDTNMERESKGLEPLDWCTEAYRFDKTYAKKDQNCKKRILAYEAGDNSALGKSMTQEEINVIPEPDKKVEPKNKYNK